MRTKDIKKTVDQVQSPRAKAGWCSRRQVDLMSKDPNSSGLASATVTDERAAEQARAKGARANRAVGIELDRNQHANDVTAQVADVGARVKAANDSLNRLDELLHTPATSPSWRTSRTRSRSAKPSSNRWNRSKVRCRSR